MKDGILVLNKPQNWTSSDCVALTRGVLRCSGVKKVGHGGTLDPMATGILPVFAGRATRIMEYLDVCYKVYRCGARLGVRTDTLDIWGRVLERRDFAGISRGEICDALSGFRGHIEQIPPKFSAVRINGKRLYEYAYSGQEIEAEIKPRKVNIASLDILDINAETGDISFEVKCSKGTYIRAICADLGEKLGCGCVMTALKRTAVGNMRLDDEKIKAVSPETIKDMRARMGDCGAAAELEDMLLPCDYPLVYMGRAALDAAGAGSFISGNAIPWERLRVIQEPDSDGLRASGRAGAEGSMPKNARGRSYDRIYRIYNPAGEFMGTGYRDAEEDMLKADKVFAKRER